MSLPEDIITISIDSMTGDPRAALAACEQAGELLITDGDRPRFRLVAVGGAADVSIEDKIALCAWRILMTHKNAFLELAR